MRNLSTSPGSHRPTRQGSSAPTNPVTDSKEKDASTSAQDPEWPLCSISSTNNLGDTKHTLRSPTSRQSPFHHQQQNHLHSAANKKPELNSFFNRVKEGQRSKRLVHHETDFDDTFYADIALESLPSASSYQIDPLRMVQKKTSGPTDTMNGSGKRQITAPYTRGGTNKAQNGSRSSFQTDTSISAGSRLAGGRDLQRWAPDAGGSSSNGLGDGGLEDTSDSKQPWDQFAANKAKFGVETDYDENIYTTTIDRNRPDYQEKLARAEQLARRIESSAPVSAHTAEERIMDHHAAGPDDGQTEEDKYSGVKRLGVADFPPLSRGTSISSATSNVYTPPARRAPTGQATVKGAPVDPAIISSQLRGGEKSACKQEDVSTSAPKAASSETLPPAAKVADSTTKDGGKLAESADKSQADTKKQETFATLKEFGKTLQDKDKDKNGGPVHGKGQPIEDQVAKAFKNFAQKERHVVREKAEDAKKKKLKELMTFANTFKLGTPVPNDLIGIIAKDPKKQAEIQEKAKKNAEEVQRTKELVAKKTEAIVKDAGAATAKPSSSSTKPSETTAAPAAGAISASDTRAAGRGAAFVPPVNAAATGPNRHPGGNRQSYGPGQYQQQFRNDRAPGQNMARHNQQSGHMAQHLRNTEQQRMAQAPLRNPDMRVPPTGPSNAMGPQQVFLGRNPGMPAMGPPPRLNPSSMEFKPNAPSFVPTGPSAASSPHSTLNHIAPAMAPPVSLPQPAPKFRKVRPIDVNMCNALSGVQALQPEPAKKLTWEENGLRPPYETQITWKTVQPTEESKISWKDQFERPPMPSVMATPTNVPAVPQQMPHQHQLPLYMQQGAQIAGPRQSPHIPPIPMHGGHPGHAQHMPFNGEDGARMMHPNSSQQPFASPRPGHAPPAFAPPNMNSPHMQYSQPVMQGYMPGPGGPQMGTAQMRYAQTPPQYMPQQHGQMGPPMMMGPQGYSMSGPQHMMPGGPQMQQMGYPNTHPNYVSVGPVPPQGMQGANGYPSPGRPAAPMMAPQGSQQGNMYNMSPSGMPFQQPQFQPQPGQMGNMRVNSNPGPQQGHQYGPQQNRGNGYGGGKNFAGPHQGPPPTANGPGGLQARTSDAPEESK